MTGTVEKLPHWDLSNVYPGLDSAEFEQSYEIVVSFGRLDCNCPL